YNIGPHNQYSYKAHLLYRHGTGNKTHALPVTLYPIHTPLDKKNAATNAAIIPAVIRRSIFLSIY
ncbi:MAG: hypothetical protein WA667_06980, partial [Candidatus Nitrosopolaris sp.]